MPAELLRISAITFIVRWEQETMFFLRRQVFFRATETNGRAKERSGLLSENQVVLPNLLFSNNRLLTAL